MAILLPLGLLAWRRHLLWPAAVAILLLLGPVMQLCLPWRPLLSSVSDGGEQGLRLRILTCNADGTALDAELMAALVAETQPDVILFQAWTSRHQPIIFGPAAEEAGWHFRRDGELLLASRFPVRQAEPHAHPALGRVDGAMARYELQTAAGPVHVFNLHLATPRDGLSAVASRDWDNLEALEWNIHLRRHQSQLGSDWTRGVHGPVLVAGDFNTPPDSPIFRDYWSSFTNAFSHAGTGFGNTHFTRLTAIRIDHVLAGPGCCVRRCWVGPKVGSAHRPVIADVVLPAQLSGDGSTTGRSAAGKPAGSN
jgi:endonuclease/exonuclease/phosphatase (EEP) superfamily protein YafD